MSLLLAPGDKPGFLVRCRVPKPSTIRRPHLGYYYHTRGVLEERLLSCRAGRAFGGLALRDSINYVRWRMARRRALSSLWTIWHNTAGMPAGVAMVRAFVYAVCKGCRDGYGNAKRICMIRFQVIEGQRRIRRFGANGVPEAGGVAGRALRPGGAPKALTDLLAGHGKL